MNIKGFLSGYSDVLFGSAGDDIFVCLRLLLNGMCSARIAKILNYAGSFMADDEVYLEIGTYTGFSLISAGYQSNKMFFGIDNFSQNFCTVGKVCDKLTENINKYPGGYTIIDGDFRNVNLKTVLPPNAKIGVFFIDGSHTYTDVMESMEWSKGFLSDDALVVFDDLVVPGVKKAVDEIKAIPGFREFCFADGDPASPHTYIHNGFSLVSKVPHGNG